ncbi:MAG: metallophosphoesterase family protein [Clostridia bacterium]|nr:metallophosphoesterase family protein [Clostridia bacterium]
MSVFYIADTHFGHENMIKLTNRPFKTVEEMDKILIENWNKRVKGNDKVYILGDMFFKTTGVCEILKQLKGEKHLILGNHDTSWIEEYEIVKKDEKGKKIKNTDTLSHKSYRFTETKEDVHPYFKSVNDILQAGDKDVGFILCHYPLLTWKHEKRLLMIHGHIHNNTKDLFFPIIANDERILNAGVEINGYMPVTLEEMKENNKAFKERYKLENGTQA